MHQYNVLEAKYRHIDIKSGKIWAMVDGKNIIARHDLLTEEQPKNIDSHFLDPQKIKKILVS